MRKIISVVMIIGVLLCAAPLSIAEEEPLFTIRNGVQFGMTRQQIINIEGQPGATDHRSYTYNTSISGDPAYIVFYFDDSDKLCGIFYLFSETHYNSDRYISDYKNIEKSLENKYGTPYLTNEYWTSSTYKAIYSETPGLAVQMGYLGYVDIILYNETYIVHSLIGNDNMEVGHFITYSPMDYESFNKYLNGDDSDSL